MGIIDRPYSTLSQGFLTLIVFIPACIFLMISIYDLVAPVIREKYAEHKDNKKKKKEEEEKERERKRKEEEAVEMAAIGEPPSTPKRQTVNEEGSVPSPSTRGVRVGSRSSLSKPTMGESDDGGSGEDDEKKEHGDAPSTPKRPTPFVFPAASPQGIEIQVNGVEGAPETIDERRRRLERQRADEERRAKAEQRKKEKLLKYLEKRRQRRKAREKADAERAEAARQRREERRREAEERLLEPRRSSHHIQPTDDGTIGDIERMGSLLDLNIPPSATEEKFMDEIEQGLKVDSTPSAARDHKGIISSSSVESVPQTLNPASEPSSSKHTRVLSYLLESDQDTDPSKRGKRHRRRRRK